MIQFMTLMIPMTLLFVSISSQSQDKNWAGMEEMNDIKIKDYKGFEKKWKLVTVRYRKDTGEMRFTYANDKAWKNLQKGVKEYPEGSVFAKVGFIVADDPAFTSSSVPKGTRRFQFMVRDKKYKGTDGWGYALFDSSGVTFREDPVLTMHACHACHRLVPDRGYVFSELLDFNPFSGSYRALDGTGPTRLQFRDGNVSELPEKPRALLPANVGSIRLITGEIQKNIFEGTLNEVRPALALEVKQKGVPAALVSDDLKSFSIVFPAKDSKLGCAEKASAIELTSAVSYAIPDPKDPTKLASVKQMIVENFCWR